MNWDTAKGNWTVFRGTVKIHWGRLTHDHLSVISGRHDQLAGEIQKGYASTKRPPRDPFKRLLGSHRERGRRI